MRRTGFSAGIKFFYEQSEGSWRLRPARHHREWLLEGLRREGIAKAPQQIAYHFVSLSTMQALHAEFLSDPQPTDILTFDYSTPSALIAEIFVCPAYIRSMAKQIRQRYGDELRRVLAHGLLHLLGYQDHTPAERLRMRFAEERWLCLWREMFHMKHSAHEA